VVGDLRKSQKEVEKEGVVEVQKEVVEEVEKEGVVEEMVEVEKEVEEEVEDTDIVVGSEVEGNYKGLGRWFLGRVTRDRGNIYIYMCINIYNYV
jgi:hypothetical protein